MATPMRVFCRSLCLCRKTFIRSKLPVVYWQTSYRHINTCSTLLKNEGSKDTSSSSSSSSSDSDEEKPATTETLNLAKPPKRIHVKNAESVIESESEPIPQVDPKLVSAAKSAAQSLSGDVAKTESTLLHRLTSFSSAEKTAMLTNSKEHRPISELNLKIEKRRGPTVRRGQYRRGTSKEDLFSNVTTETVIGRTQVEEEGGVFLTEFGKQGVKRDLKQMRLFKGSRLEIFSDKFNAENRDTKTTEDDSLYSTLEKEEVTKLLNVPPSNAFEEMINWTKEGKLWTFPIDNETGMDKESKVRFHEHVFLEPLLEGFPTTGPVRHFMDLVTVALSKNPYLTVEMKKDHIQWFREYFESKKDLLPDTESETQAVEFKM